MWHVMSKMNYGSDTTIATLRPGGVASQMLFSHDTELTLRAAGVLVNSNRGGGEQLANQAALNAYLAEETHSLKLTDTHAAYEGGFIAGLSERTQLPEAMAFAACKLTFKRAPPSAVLMLTTTTPPKASQKQQPAAAVQPKDNVHRFTAFFLQYKAATPIDPEHVCFRILHIKAITTRPATDDGYMLSYITLHSKRSEASILNCIHEFNYWHFQTPIELHPSLPIGLRMQREAYAACRKQLMFAAAKAPTAAVMA